MDIFILKGADRYLRVGGPVLADILVALIFEKNFELYNKVCYNVKIRWGIVFQIAYIDSVYFKGNLAL